MVLKFSTQLLSEIKTGLSSGDERTHSDGLKF